VTDRIPYSEEDRRPHRSAMKALPRGAGQGLGRHDVKSPPNRRSPTPAQGATRADNRRRPRWITGRPRPLPGAESGTPSTTANGPSGSPKLVSPIPSRPTLPASQAIGRQRRSLRVAASEVPRKSEHPAPRPRSTAAQHLPATRLQSRFRAGSWDTRDTKLRPTADTIGLYRIGRNIL
jgi:hypothetical protein